jgi:hypothetical protein
VSSFFSPTPLLTPPISAFQPIYNLASNFPRCRFFSTKFPEAVVHVRGDLPYGSREYLLLPLHVDRNDTQAVINEETLAKVHAHCNILFGAQSNHDSVSDICAKLVEQALDDAGETGEQPQAVSTLHGLCDFVKEQLLLLQDNSDACTSATVLALQAANNTVALEAVRAIATGIPRPGHAVVGQGTHRDAGEAWSDLAREFIAIAGSDECVLYQTAGGQLISIELLADTNPDYLASAGGAMARFFFL